MCLKASRHTSPLTGMVPQLRFTETYMGPCVRYFSTAPKKQLAGDGRSSKDDCSRNAPVWTVKSLSITSSCLRICRGLRPKHCTLHRRVFICWATIYSKCCCGVSVIQVTVTLKGLSQDNWSSFSLFLKTFSLLSKKLSQMTKKMNKQKEVKLNWFKPLADKHPLHPQRLSHTLHEKISVTLNILIFCWMLGGCRVKLWIF